MCFLILRFGFFELNLVDLDAVLWIGEFSIYAEGVGVVDVFAFGSFGENAVFGAGEGLEGSLEFVVA
jgi:hypothetical protein